ncbi:MAG: hypothetical protein R3C11_11540 [Planctomycetaceae bacterium]
MKINWTLLRWQLRQVYPINLIALILSVLYVLFTEELLLFTGISLPLLFILLHVGLVSFMLGRFHSAASQYLYGQGFSRKELWRTNLLANLSSMLIVWIPLCILIYFGLRSQLQDYDKNYRFPVLAPLEYSFPIAVLVTYLLILPLFQYCFVRLASPLRRSFNSVVLLICFLLIFGTIATSFNLAYVPTSVVILAVCGFAFASLVLLIKSSKLHQSMEVRN